MPEPVAAPDAFLETVREKYRPATEAAAPAPASTPAATKPALPPQPGSFTDHVKQVYQDREEIAATIEAMRSDPTHPLHHPGHPQHAAAQEGLLFHYRQLHGGAPPRDPAAVPPIPGAPAPPEISVFDDPVANPQTAADLDASPPVEFSDDAKERGWNYDPAGLKQFHAMAEQEDMVGLAAEGERLIVRVVAEPPPDYDDAVRDLQGRWGSSFAANLKVARAGFDFFKAKQPSDAAVIETAGYHSHPQLVEHFYRVGQRLTDTSTRGGFRRVKEKYTKLAKDARS
jgi:hypothetical protein